MNRLIHASCLLVIVGAVVGCEQAPAAATASNQAITSIRVSAAASLADVLERLKPLVRQSCGIDLVIDSGSSGTLAQQIIHGAPADVIISANTQWMDELQRRGLLLRDSRTDLWQNQLVVIRAKSSSIAVDKLEKLTAPRGRIAIGEPSSVPAGQYARQAMMTAGIWTSVQPRLLPAVDVRAALAYVARGEADFGLVYATDAKFSNSSVDVLFTVPDAMHQPIVYPAAVIASTEHPLKARNLIAFLRTRPAMAVAQDAGFRETSTDAGGLAR